jgi:endoribonuclease Dicer
MPCRYRFRARRLAEEALTHCSWPGSGSTCYQRLEFVGDAVLDVLVTRYFFTQFK